MRPRHILALLALTATVLGGPALRADTIDWDFLSQIAPSDRELIAHHLTTARELARSALELAHHFPSPLLELEVRRDLTRLRWRIADGLAGVRWTDALVCPEDRAVLEKVEGVMALRSARSEWIRMRIDGDRLVRDQRWEGRAFLLRPDGGIVRLMVISP